MRRLRSIVKPRWYFASRRKCPVCDRSSPKFAPSGVDGRKNARCPQCGSLERHRLTAVFLRSRTDLFDGKAKKFLHVAPESCFVNMFKEAAGDGYLSADLLSRNAMETMDITSISHTDDSFDVIYCSHVLEHVQDDIKAMSELFRVLKPNGWAVLNVPVTADKTYEDPLVTDPAERERLFGQHDHVRRYGPDYEDRLISAGFSVTRYSASQLVSESEIVRFGLTNEMTGDVFHCVKNSRGTASS